MKEWGLFKQGKKRPQTAAVVINNRSNTMRPSAFNEGPGEVIGPDMTPTGHDPVGAKFVRMNSNDELEPQEETKERSHSPQVRMEDTPTTSATRSSKKRSTMVMKHSPFLPSPKKVAIDLDRKGERIQTRATFNTHQTHLNHVSGPGGLTQANLAKAENSAKRGGFGSSLINVAMGDLQKTNKIKSQYNAQTAQGSNMKAGQMLQCMNMAQQLSGGPGGVGSMFVKNTMGDEEDDVSLQSGHNSLNPFANMMMANKANSTFGFGLGNGLM